MAVTDDVLPETELTDHDGITEWKVVATFDKVSDGPEWEHWRTSPNYTCMRDEEGMWLVQVGRNDPVVSVVHLGKGIDGTAILISPEDAVLLMIQTAKSPKDAFIEMIERSDERGVFVQQHASEPSPARLQAARQRQETWGDRATETPTRDSEGDA